MFSLNLKHLRYFWVLAANGSIARASEILHLTPQTISGQLLELEEQLKTRLFQKSGRNLVLNPLLVQPAGLRAIRSATRSSCVKSY